MDNKLKLKLAEIKANAHQIDQLKNRYKNIVEEIEKHIPYIPIPERYWVYKVQDDTAYIISTRKNNIDPPHEYRLVEFPIYRDKEVSPNEFECNPLAYYNPYQARCIINHDDRYIADLEARELKEMIPVIYDYIHYLHGITGHCLNRISTPDDHDEGRVPSKSDF